MFGHTSRVIFFDHDLSTPQGCRDYVAEQGVTTLNPLLEMDERVFMPIVLQHATLADENRKLAHEKARKADDAGRNKRDAERRHALAVEQLRTKLAQSKENTACTERTLQFLRDCPDADWGAVRAVTQLPLNLQSQAVRSDGLVDGLPGRAEPVRDFSCMGLTHASIDELLAKKFKGAHGELRARLVHFVDAREKTVEAFRLGEITVDECMLRVKTAWEQAVPGFEETYFTHTGVKCKATFAVPSKKRPKACALRSGAVDEMRDGDAARQGGDPAQSRHTVVYANGGYAAVAVVPVTGGGIVVSCAKSAKRAANAGKAFACGFTKDLERVPPHLYLDRARTVGGDELAPSAHFFKDVTEEQYDAAKGSPSLILDLAGQGRTLEVTSQPGASLLTRQSDARTTLHRANVPVRSEEDAAAEQAGYAAETERLAGEKRPASESAEPSKKSRN